MKTFWLFFIALKDIAIEQKSDQVSLLVAVRLEITNNI